MATNGAGPVIPRDFFSRHSVEVAPDLLGCVIEHQATAGLVAVELTEVEAYAGETDPASHAYRGKTRRNAVMFGPPGHAYVYFTYGMHFCVNLVCLGENTASAVLLRAGAVIAGEDLARAQRTGGRGAGRDALPARDLARGPARLCQALGIDRSLDGADVCAPGSALRVRPRNSTARSAEKNIRSGPRVGVAAAAEVPWRFWIEGEPTVSAYRAASGGRPPPDPPVRGDPSPRAPLGLPPSGPMMAPCRRERHHRRTPMAGPARRSYRS